MSAFTAYQQLFHGATMFEAETFPTAQQAESRAQELGGSGHHTHETEDGVVYMPFANHSDYEAALESQNGVDYEEDTGFVEEMRDKIRKRLEQLLASSSTDNGV